MNIYARKKILFTICMFILLLFLPVKSLAATVYTEGDFYYELQDESIVITGYFGSDTEITLPDKIAGYPVSKIATGAFIGTTVKVINIPDTIMTIEENAIAAGITVNYAAEQNGNQSSGEEKTENDSTENKENVGGNSDSDVNMDNKGQVDEVEINIEDNPLEENQSVSNLKTDKVYVNNNGYLVKKDDDGREIVIDDSKKYMQTTDADGNDVIKDEAGNEVKISDDGSAVNYVGNQGKSVTKELTKSKDESKKRINYILPVVLVVVVLLIVVIIGVFIWRRKKK